MVSQRLTLIEKLSYGFGDMGTSLAYNMASAFLLFYYTNVVHLPAAAVGTVFLVARLLDAVDYNEWKTGARHKGLLSSGISLATKVGMAAGTAGFAYTLGATGYSAESVTDPAREAIRWAYYGSAAVLLTVQVLAALFWPMDGRHAQMRGDIGGRAASAA